MEDTISNLSSSFELLKKKTLPNFTYQTLAINLISTYISDDEENSKYNNNESANSEKNTKDGSNNEIKDKAIKLKKAARTENNIFEFTMDTGGDEVNNIYFVI